MSYRKTENTIALLGTALAGAAAMYLLDPQQGERRRAALRKSASEAAERAEALAGEGWEQVAGKAKSVRDSARAQAADYGAGVADAARGYANDFASRARDAGTDAAQRASEQYQTSADYLGERFGNISRRIVDRAREIVGGVSQSGQQAAARAGEWLGRGSDSVREAAEPSTPFFAITVTGVGCIAAGGAAMYLLDPEKGRARRAYLGDQVMSMLKRTGRTFHRTGRHMGNRMRGVAAEAQSFVSAADYVSGDELLHRVRSVLGHAATHPRLIQVMTDSNGNVTLSGDILASDLPRTLKAVAACAGVREVANRMQSKDSIDANRSSLADEKKRDHPVAQL